jgi:hypothetical protein
MIQDSQVNGILFEEKFQMQEKKDAINIYFNLFEIRADRSFVIHVDFVWRFEVVVILFGLLMLLWKLLKNGDSLLL